MNSCLLTTYVEWDHDDDDDDDYVYIYLNNQDTCYIRIVQVTIVWFSMYLLLVFTHI